VHRIGRTGRCGHKGKATSFYDEEKDSEIKEKLIKIFEDAQQPMPECLADGGTGNVQENGAGDDDEDEDGW